MNTELEGVLERLFAGLEDLLGKFDLERDFVEVGVLVLEAAREGGILERDFVDVGVLVLEAGGILEREGIGDLVRLFDGHWIGGLFPEATYRLHFP